MSGIHVGVSGNPFSSIAQWEFHTVADVTATHSLALQFGGRDQGNPFSRRLFVVFKQPEPLVGTLSTSCYWQTPQRHQGTRTTQMLPG